MNGYVSRRQARKSVQVADPFTHLIYAMFCSERSENRKQMNGQDERSEKINTAPGRVGPKSIILVLAAASDLVFVGAKMAWIFVAKYSVHQAFSHFVIILAPRRGPRPEG